MPEKNIKIGEKIKSLRIKKGMSTADVSQNSGISEAIITGIEDHTISPPLGNIISLANVFQVTVGDLFGDSADSPFCIVRSDDRKTVSRFTSTDGKSGAYNYESLGHQKQNRHMEPFLVTLSPVEVPQLEPNQHVGEEIIFVLEGQVDVMLSDHTDILNPGDSIYYDSNLPHIVSCHGEKPATILAVIYAEKEMLIF
jgi:quercetin dioxygenase-like cupin family protein/DNA-binding XRE family transcriptional regulator